MSQTSTIELDSIPASINPANDNTVDLPRSNELSKRRGAVIIGSITGINFLNALGSGILTVALPRVANDLKLSRELLLWPASIYALACGCTLLLSGSVADIVGRRITFLVGTLRYAAFTLACGLATSPSMLLAFRALQGISISLCLTTSVGILSAAFEKSERRNIAFAVMGAGSPMGYTVGLVLGGIFVDRLRETGPGWRWSFYLAAILNVLVFGAAVWAVPADKQEEGERRGVWKRLLGDIDWVGAGLATVGISLLSYVMAVVTGSSSNIKEPTNIVLLTLALLLLPAFAFWMSFQERRGKPAMIPNSIWKQSAFTTSCISVFLSWGAFNVFGYFATLFFQEIQQLTALQTSLRLLPTVVCGLLSNIATGLLVKHTSASYLVAVSSLLSAVACLLMALVRPEWTFWAAAFPAVFLSPMAVDVLYTVSNLIIADAFPASKQSLAGGVFYTATQIGNSVGLTVGAVIASSVTNSSGEMGVDGMEKGYRATFWAAFGATLCVGVIRWVGLWRAGKVGLKAD